MKKNRFIKILFTIFMFSLCGYATAQEFGPSSTLDSSKEDGKLIKKAKKLKNDLSAEISIETEEIQRMANDIIDPFSNKLPKPKNVQTVRPSVENNDIDPYVEDAEPPPSANLSGLVWNSDIPQAIINNKVVNVGDSISGWVIENISKAGVLLKSVGNQEYLIKP